VDPCRTARPFDVEEFVTLPDDTLEDLVPPCAELLDEIDVEIVEE
jgi:hypothetical protein